jgi:PPK2 family polyphosphate:nucleotide phosphotransferase
MITWEKTSSATWLAPKKVSLDEIDPGGTPTAPGDRAATEAKVEKLRTQLADLQDAFRAEESGSVLLVLQAMDAGGKDGCVKQVFKGTNPMGLQVTSFGLPTPEELAHDFLWRIHARCPAKGIIGIFNRSHYEDVLAVRVRDIVPRSVWLPRYSQISNFEDILAASGTTIVKVMLHISNDEQKLRLQKRIDNPNKRWKFRTGDLDDRKLWPEYMRAYEDAIEKTNSDEAPWFIVPADKKWYRDFAVLTIMIDALKALNPSHPKFAEYDGIVVD